MRATTFPCHRDDDLAAKLVEQGFVVQPGFVPPATVAALRGEFEQVRAAGGFRPALVAHGRHYAPEIRSDLIHWIEEEEAGPATRGWLARLETLRQTLNRVAYLGLLDFEAHYALYPPGAHYVRHRDRLRGDARRVLTSILYLNDAWQAEDGGALRLWLDEEGVGDSMQILPQGGTLVLFLSARYWHAVEPARRERLSLTGWFRARG